MIADMGSWRMRCGHGTSPSISGFLASMCLRLANIWSAAATEKHPWQMAGQIYWTTRPGWWRCDTAILPGI